MDNTIPRLRGKTLDDKLTVPLEKTLKRELIQLKTEYGVDHLEWIRQLIRSNFPTLKQKVTAA